MPTLNQQEQTDLSARLQTKWLQHMERILDEGTITSMDMATLARLLMQNGWCIDPKQIPQKLQDKLTSSVAFEGEDYEPKLRIAR